MAENIFNRFGDKKTAKAFDYIAERSSYPVGIDELEKHIKSSAYEAMRSVKKLESLGFAKLMDFYTNVQITQEGLEYYKLLPDKDEKR